MLWKNGQGVMPGPRGGTVSKRTKIIAAVAALAVIGGIAAFVAFGSGGAGPEVESATATEQQLAVTVTASGRVEKGVSADVFPPTTGTLAEVKVSEGETVTAGQVLAQMDTEPLELQVAQARAGLSQAEAQLAAVGQGASQADITAARAGVAAAEQAYAAAREQAAAVGTQAPSNAQIAAASAATVAARTAYDNALAAYNAAVALSPNPSADATVAVAAAQRDQAYAGYLGARAQEEALRNTDLSAARAQAQAGVGQAYAGVKSAQAQLARLQSTDTAAACEAARAAVAQAAQALALAERNLEAATLVAPIDGIVIVEAGGGGAAAAAAAAAGGAGAASSGGVPKEGSAVSPGAPVFTVVDLDALKFSAEVDEADISRISVGMPAEVTLDAFPGDVFKTKVARVNPAAQSTATGGTVFVVELALDDTSRDVLLGMKGDVDVEVSSVGAALTIPVEALFSEGGTDYVYVVEDGVLNKTEITVGATTDTDVEVLEGLAVGDRVALSGSVQYTDGMAVRLKGQ